MFQKSFFHYKTLSELVWERTIDRMKVRMGDTEKVFFRQVFVSFCCLCILATFEIEHRHIHNFLKLCWCMRPCKHWDISARSNTTTRGGHNGLTHPYGYYHIDAHVGTYIIQCTELRLYLGIENKIVSGLPNGVVYKMFNT